MTSHQVVLYFEKPEDAVRFTIAASSLMAADQTGNDQQALALAREFGKVSRIKIEEVQSTTMQSSAA